MKPKLCYEGVKENQSADLCLEGYNEEDCVHLLRKEKWRNCKSGRLHKRYQFLLDYPTSPTKSEGEEIICPWCNYHIDDYYEMKDGNHECPNCYGVFTLETECIRVCSTYINT